jgi:hypothetical protein
MRRMSHERRSESPAIVQLASRNAPAPQSASLSQPRLPCHQDRRLVDPDAPRRGSTTPNPPLPAPTERRGVATGEAPLGQSPSKAQPVEPIAKSILPQRGRGISQDPTLRIHVPADAPARGILLCMTSIDTLHSIPRPEKRDATKKRSRPPWGLGDVTRLRTTSRIRLCN